MVKFHTASHHINLHLNSNLAVQLLLAKLSQISFKDSSPGLTSARKKSLKSTGPAIQVPLLQ